MWETIKEIVVNGNVFVILVLAISVFALVKSNTVKVKTKHFQMGVDPREVERKVLRRQVEFLTDYLRGKEGELSGWIEKNLEREANKVLVNLVLEHLIDEVTSWCMFNHILLDDEYIRLKEMHVRSVVEKESVIPFEWYDRFAELYRPWVRELISNLHNIRNMSNGNDIY